MRTQKKVANINLIVVVVIIVAVAGYFVFVKKSVPNTTQQTTTTTVHAYELHRDPVYRNEKYEFPVASKETLEK